MAETKRPGMKLDIPKEFADEIRSAAKVSGIPLKKIREVLAEKLFEGEEARSIPMMVHEMIGSQLGLTLDE